MKKQSLEKKIELLKKNIQNLGKVIVAFSGGVDSSLLLIFCKKVLKQDLLAVTIDSDFVPKHEIKAAKDLAKKYKIKHKVIKFDILNDKIIAHNPRERCYFCKRKIMIKLLDIALKQGYDYVLEGSHSGDLNDYRPGKKALKELGIISPLAKSSLNKMDIKAISHKIGLKNWDKPSMSCLATRFPYGTLLSKVKLKKVARAENMLHKYGFRQLRIRVHGDILRIEVKKEKIPKLIELIDNKEVKSIKSLGYKFICVDIEGYRFGSMD